MLTCIERDDDLRALVEAALAHTEYALDTEFHRERTYYPKLALVQLAIEGEVHLVDPLAVDITLLAPLLESDLLAILHAADQDLDVLGYAVGAIPSRLFDTQVAAGFVGMSTPSLSSLTERLLDLRPPKGDRLTDWLRRPLDEAQLTYAASDVLHLHELRDRLVADLAERDRLDWVADECEALRVRTRGGRDPQEAWMRIKEARHLRGAARGAAQALAAWREERAASLDQPVRAVLADLALVSIAQRRPRTLDQLRDLRGVDGRHLRGDLGTQLLEVVRQGSEAPPPARPDADGPTMNPRLRPAVALVATWATQRARDLDLDPAILATRTDIEMLLRGDTTGRLSQGWRAEVLGKQVQALVNGDAALAFDTGGHLALEERSGRPIS